MTDLIGIYSPYPQSGKSTLADALLNQDPRAVRIKFADAMRDVIVPFVAPFVYGGQAEVRAMLEDGRKDTYIIPGLGVTLRYMLQMLGTEWGRKLIHPRIWVMIVERKIAGARALGKAVVVDDVRYEDEYTSLWFANAYLIRVDRRAPPETKQHDSNARLDDYYFDFRPDNNGTLEEWLAATQSWARPLWDMDIARARLCQPGR